jgi:3-oxoacyl-[acyl-carrier-protein] synthase II
LEQERCFCSINSERTNAMNRPPSSVNPDPLRRVVITGIGLVTPLGPNREASWCGLRAGRSAVRALSEITAAPGPYAGAPAEPGDEAPPTAQPPRDRVVQLALRAAAEAVDDAHIDWQHLDTDRVACVLGTSKGGIGSFARAFRDRRAATALSAPHGHWWPDVWPSGAASAVAARYDLRGPLLCPVAACATGVLAVLKAAEAVRDGRCDVALAGSADASLEPVLLAAFRRMGVLARGFDDPTQACRPFDARRNGFVVGEGAAVFVVESLTSASQRGAPVYAELLAGASAAEAYDLARLSGSPEPLARLITAVLRKAALAPDEIGYVNVHGTATRSGDVLETGALKQAFGRQARRLATSATKSMIGHLLGAAGSVELAVTLLALRDGFVPPTINLTHADPQCDLDYTPLAGRPAPLETALKLSLGFGGHLVGLALRRGQDPPAPAQRPAHGAQTASAVQDTA